LPNILPNSPGAGGGETDSWFAAACLDTTAAAGFLDLVERDVGGSAVD